MTKKIVISVVILLVLIAATIGGIFLVNRQQELRKKAAPATVLSLFPATVNVPEAGQTFDLTANIDSQTNLVSGADIYITFDPVKLQMSDLVRMTFLDQQIKAPTIDNTSGTAQIVLGTFEPKQGRGDVAKMTFRSVAEGTTVVNFGPRTRATGKDGSQTTDITANKTPATVVIASSGTEPTPTTIPTPTPTQGEQQPTVAPTAVPTQGGGGSVSTPTPTKGATGGTAATNTPTSTPSAGSGQATQLPEAGLSMPVIVASFAGVLLLLVGFVLLL